MFERLFIDTNKALNVAIEELQTTSILSIDTETTGLDPHQSDLALIQIASEELKKTFFIDPFKITDTLPLRALLLNPNIAKLNFNGAFDCKFFLKYCNAYIENPIDLYLGALLLKEYGPPLGTPYDARDVKLIAFLKGMPIFDGAFGLKNVLKVFCNIDITKEQQTSDWSRRPLSDVQLEYGAGDVEPLFQLGDKIAEEIKKEGMEDTWAVENACQIVTAGMSYWGIYADPVYFDQLKRDVKGKIKSCESAIGNFPEFREAQQDIYALAAGEYSTINMNSPLQVKATLQKRWRMPVETTAANELKKEWNRDPELIELITDRASLKSMLGNSCEGMLKAIKLSTGRVHSDFSQNGSPQHRYKSSDPILLNLPKKSKYGPYVLNTESIMYGEMNFRDGFKPAAGCVMVKADYAQLQLRAIAQESGDPILLKAFNEGLDLHTITGSFIFDLPITVSKEELGKARRDCAKAQPIDADLLTPTGWKKMGEVQIGDRIIGSQGTPVKVIGVYPQGYRAVYKVTFTDDSSVECDSEHLWAVRDNHERSGNKPYRILQLKEIAEKGIFYNRKGGHKEYKFQIPLVQPVHFESSEILPLDPYLLGALIGDGGFTGDCVKFSNPEKEIVDYVSASLPGNSFLRMENQSKKRNCDYRINGGAGSGRNHFNPVIKAIKDLGLLGHKSTSKFIPEIYKYSSIESRISLLQGLMDTDGWVTKECRTVGFSTSSPQLADDMMFLIQSLGGTATKRSAIPKFTYKGETRIGQRTYKLTLAVPDGVLPFRVSRKANLHRPRIKYKPYRAIKSIEAVGEKECQCIRVDASDSLYVTKDFIVTHNTVGFAVSFLCSAETLQRTFLKDLGIHKTLEECQTFIDKFLRRYRGIAAYHKSQPNIVKRAGAVRVRGGRATLLTPNANVQTEAINFVMAMLEQSGIKKGMGRLARAFWKLSEATGKVCRIVLSVFDEILVECDFSLAFYVKQILEREMVRSMRDYIYKVPVVAEGSISESWGGSGITLESNPCKYRELEALQLPFNYLNEIVGVGKYFNNL